jgi:hypothetical protein
MIDKTKTTEEVSGKRGQLSHAQFYQLCEQIRLNAQKFKDEKVTADDAATFLSRRLGFPVGRSQIKTARKAVGTDWVPKINTSNRKAELLSATARAVAVLYHKLNEQLPEEFSALLNPGRNGKAADHK